MRLSVLDIRLASLQTRAIYLTITSASSLISCFLSFIENFPPSCNINSHLNSVIHKIVIIFFVILINNTITCIFHILVSKPNILSVHL